jgi:ATP-dependent Clp protease ATP-binding subunit ClpA
MSVVGERTQYLNLEQIERVCGAVRERLLVGSDLVVDALRRELISVSANGMRSSALGQGLFGPHILRPGVLCLAGPGGVGKTYFAELVARVMYGERFGDHLIGVNCQSYFAGRFPPLPRSKLEAGPLSIVVLDGVEVLPQLPPVAALWADAIRYGRAALPAAGDGGQIVQQELSFGRCLIVATANVGREQVAHVGFRPPLGEGAPGAGEVSPEAATRLIRDALGDLFDGAPGEAFPPDRWLVLPPLRPGDMRRLVDLQLTSLAELLPNGSPPIEIEGAAADRLIAAAQAARSPNKTVALVDLMRTAVEPAVDGALLSNGAPLPLRVRIDLDGAAPGPASAAAAGTAAGAGVRATVELVSGRA